MAETLTAPIDELVAALIAEGLAATTDPRNAHPPCALVSVESVTPRTSGLVRTTLAVVLIAPGMGNADAIGWIMGTGIPAAWRVLGTRAPGTFGSWTSPHTGVQLLACELRPTAFDQTYVEV